MNATTEAVARKRWCPFARAPGYYAYGLPTNNRSDKGEPTPRTRCIGSECMAWRWSDEEDEIEYSASDRKPKGKGWAQCNDILRAFGKKWSRLVLVENRRGFCGLAGTP